MMHRTLLVIVSVLIAAFAMLSIHPPTGASPCINDQCLPHTTYGYHGPGTAHTEYYRSYFEMTGRQFGRTDQGAYCPEIPCWVGGLVHFIRKNYDLTCPLAVNVVEIGDYNFTLAYGYPINFGDTAAADCEGEVSNYAYGNEYIVKTYGLPEYCDWEDDSLYLELFCQAPD